MPPERRRLLYRAQHRGFKEADLVIGTFAKQQVAAMTEAELEEFQRLLEVPDQELYAWIIGRETVPTNYEGPVMRQLQAFDLAAILTGDVSRA